MPPDMAEWLPPGHLVWFVLDVVDQLDTAAFHRGRRQVGPGRRGFDPDMLLALLLYSYAVGERSSRRIEALCHDHVAFRVLCAQDVPDHTTIARFRAGHEDRFADLFAQVLLLCAQAGMGRVGIVSIDGTKVAANASPGANRTEDSLRRQVKAILGEAAAVDAAEDAEFGDCRGDELPPEFADRSGRGERIKTALADIAKQREQADLADWADQAKAEEYLRRVEAGEAPMGQPPRGVDPVRLNKARLARAQGRRAAAAPKTDAYHNAGKAIQRAQRDLDQAEKAARAGPVDLRGAARKRRERRGKNVPVANVTDPDSRLMTTATGGSVQGFNVQVAVSDDHLVLATSISQDANDTRSFEPMMNAAVEAAGRVLAEQPEPTDGCKKPTGVETVLADAGYFSEHNLTVAGPDRLIAFGKQRELARQAADQPASGPPPPQGSAKEQMHHRLRTPDGRETYKRRSATVETVIAHLKESIGLRRFSRRGLTATASELNLAAAVINIRRLHGRTATAVA